MTTYCEVARGHEFHGPYHDREYGFPVRDDDRLFERLILEINQAGLSWLTILRKRENFLKAYDHFAIDRVARYGAREEARLMADAGIIRNRLKVKAAIENARRIQFLQREFGAFSVWLDAHHPLDRAEWQRLFKSTFVFTGGEIVHEFLLSTGYLPGAHVESCPVYRVVMKEEPAWARSRGS